MTDRTRVLAAVFGLLAVTAVLFAAGAGTAVAAGDTGTATIETNEADSDASTAEDPDSEDRSWVFEGADDEVETSPTVADGRVYVGSLDGHAYAIDAATGTEVWNASTGGNIVVGSPAVDDGRVYVGALDGHITGGSVHALEAASGEEAWNVTNVQAVVGAPVVSGDTVYVAGTNETDHTGAVYALNASTGEERWNHSLEYDLRSAPALDDGTLYVSGRNEDSNGTVRAIDAETGALEWTMESTAGAIDSAPTVAGETLYVGSDDATVYALNATTGNTTWTADTELAVKASPTVVGDTVYVGNYGPPADDPSAGVYALNATTGEQRWATNETAAISVAVAVHDGTVFAGDESGIGEDSDGTVHAVDAESGTVEWTFERPTHFIRSPPTVHEDVLYVGNQDGNVYAVPTAAPVHGATVEFADDPTADRVEVDSNRSSIGLTAENSSLAGADREALTVEWTTDDAGSGSFAYPADDPWNATYEFAEVDAGETFDVTLTVTDEAGRSRTDAVTVSVDEAEPPAATLAFASENASDRLDVAADRDAVDLTAANTTDPQYDLGELAYDWSLSGNASGELNASSPTAENWNGTYEFDDADAGETFDATLTVTNPAGESDTASVTISVAAADESDDEENDDSGGSGPSLGAPAPSPPSQGDSDAPAAFDVDLGVLSGGAVPGESADVTVTVANTGDQTGTANLDVEVDGGVDETVSVTLDGGEETTETVSVTIPAVDSDVEILARSSDGTVKASTTLGLADPELAIESTDLPDEAAAGEDVTVTVTVANEGVIATEATVEYRVGGAVLATEEVALEPGESETVSLSATLPESLDGGASQSVRVADAESKSSLAVAAAGDSVPGFGIGAALVGLLATLVARRRLH